VYDDKKDIKMYLPERIRQNPLLMDLIYLSRDPYLTARQIILENPEYPSGSDMGTGLEPTENYTTRNDIFATSLLSPTEEIQQTSESERMAHWSRNAPSGDFKAHVDRVVNGSAGDHPKPWDNPTFLADMDYHQSLDTLSGEPLEDEQERMLLADRLTFDGNRLRWIGEENGREHVIQSWPAYSGKPWENLEPIPPGTYYTGRKGDREKKPHEEWWRWGPFGYRLHQGLITGVKNYLNGHDGGFFIHGGYKPGTGECIEFIDYEPKQRYLGDFDRRRKKYGKEIRLDVDYDRR